ncbi:MAG: hypothetical protein V4660_12970 [Pseudomonadota bacterium]
MKGFYFFIVFCCVFSAGYFTKSIMMEKRAINECLETNSNQIAPATHAGEMVSHSTYIATVGEIEDKKVSLQSSSLAQKIKINIEPAKADNKPNVNAGEAGGRVAANDYSKEISDEEIDKILSEPFSTSLKNRHGVLREKYKDFVENTESFGWDKNMKNKLSDAIFGSPLSKYISVESLECRANLCEIRLYETKAGVWSHIQSGMALEDWWDIGASSSSGFKTESASGWYVLLAKR